MIEARGLVKHYRVPPVIGDHHGQTPRRATPQVTVMDEISARTSSTCPPRPDQPERLKPGPLHAYTGKGPAAGPAQDCRPDGPGSALAQPFPRPRGTSRHQRPGKWTRHRGERTERLTPVTR